MDSSETTSIHHSDSPKIQKRRIGVQLLLNPDKIQVNQRDSGPDREKERFGEAGFIRNPVGRFRTTYEGKNPGPLTTPLSRKNPIPT